jgi:hypothetical protein
MATNQQNFDAIVRIIADIRNHLFNYSVADPIYKRAARVRDFITNPGRNVLHEHKVSRGGKEIPVIQEIADAKSLGLENKATLAALTELVTQMNTGQTIDYTRIEEIQRRVQAEGVTVTIEVPNQKAV